MEHRKSNQRGFALILSMVMLLAMTLMGSVLLMNASSQSKVTGKSESSRQTFLSAETGVEAARRWLSIEAATGTLPKNGSSSVGTLCKFQLDDTYKVAGDDGTSGRGIKMTSELGVTNSGERLIYDNQSFMWFTTEHTTTNYKGTGIGGGIGGGTGYVGGGGNMTSYLYKVFACGKGPGSSNAYTRTLIEAIVGINK